MNLDSSYAASLYKLKEVTMVSKNDLDILNDAFKHEIAAQYAYQDVLQHITSTTYKNQINDFLKDHNRHLQALKEIIQKETNELPEESRDWKGLLLSGYTAVRSLTGEDGALKALQTAEHNILKMYQEHCKNLESTEYRDLFEKHLKDEERHNNYVDSVVESL